MADANEDLFDASLRHQIGVRRFASGEVKEILKLLEESDKQLVKLIRRRLRQGRKNLTTERLRALVRDIRALRKDAVKQLQGQLTTDLLELARMEQGFEERIAQAAIPVRLDFAVASLATLRAAVVEQPFAGGANAALTLQQWFDNLSRADQTAIIGAIQQGVSQEETIDSIVRRVVGTGARDFRDGAVTGTRRKAEAVVRTAVNHVSNAARESFWDENEELLIGLRWNSTLDGRTSPVCRGRDGRIALFGDHSLPKGMKLLSPQTARPPAHPNCRSIMTAVLDDEGIADSMGDRPFVRDTRTRRFRERDFRAETRDALGRDKWKQLTVKERNNEIRKTKQRWAKANIGQVPADVNYNDWLTRQPREFQEEVLGKTKAKLFAKGELTLDKFLDRRGQELTLKQLATTRPEAFVSAGLNPEDF